MSGGRPNERQPLRPPRNVKVAAVSVLPSALTRHERHHTREHNELVILAHYTSARPSGRLRFLTLQHRTAWATDRRNALRALDGVDGADLDFALRRATALVVANTGMGSSGWRESCVKEGSFPVTRSTR